MLAPLEKVELNHEQEHEAYFYANSMIEAKTVMALSVMSNSMEETFAEYEKLKEEARNANKEDSKSQHG